MMMKAVNMKGKAGGDDAFNRLLTYLKNQIQQEILVLRPIRKDVCYVKTSENEFVLKGYTRLQRLKLHEAFTESLKKEGFLNTYSFYPIAKEGTLFFEQKYYGCLEYINPHPDVFSFREHNDRIEGLNLICEFHQVTKSLVKRYETLLPSFNLLEKWQERTNIFIANLSAVRYFIQEPVMNELLRWARTALAGLEREYDFFKCSPSVIVHGDVAHHNFMRTDNRKLYLIDYDLISSGSAATDILQYANRILPFLSWSVKNVSSYPDINQYLQEKAFLYALLYPTDIFREWNRLVREKKLGNQIKVRQILNMTLDQFELRQKFSRELEEMIK